MGIFHMPPAPTIECIAFPVWISSTRVVGTFVIINEPILIHHYHPKPILCIRAYSWCCTCCGSRQLYNNVHPSLCIIVFSLRSKSSVLHLVIPHLSPLLLCHGNHRSFTVSVNFAFFRMSYCWNHPMFVAFSLWFLLLNNKHLSFLHVFSWLASSFLFITE